MPRSRTVNFILNRILIILRKCHTHYTVLGSLLEDVVCGGKEKGEIENRGLLERKKERLKDVQPAKQASVAKSKCNFIFAIIQPFAGTVEWQLMPWSYATCTELIARRKPTRGSAGLQPKNRKSFVRFVVDSPEYCRCRRFEEWQLRAPCRILGCGNDEDEIDREPKDGNVPLPIWVGFQPGGS